jgi:hypothetical protein
MAELRLSESAKVLASYATELRSLGAMTPADWLIELANGLEVLGEFTMSGLLAKCASPIEAAKLTASKKSQNPTGADVAGVVASLARVLKQAQETKYSNDLLSLVQLIDQKLLYLESILVILKDTMMPPAPDLDLIAKKLKSATGTDQFERHYAELSSLNIDKNGLVQIARAVYGANPKALTKTAAMSAIRKLHDTSMRTRRSLDTQGGRSAA